MKSWLIAALMATVALTLAPAPAEAKRFGGGSSFGVKRTAPPPQRPAEAPKAPPSTQPANAPATSPAQPATAAAPAAAGGAAAAAGARSWLGPVAGLAAGIGLVALMSHLGLGEELASFVMLALLAVVAVVALRFLLRRFAGGATPQPALARAAASAGAAGPDAWARRETPMPGPTTSAGGAAQGGSGAATAAPSVQIGSALQPPLALGEAAAEPAAPVAPALPPGFDAEAFERIARAIFIRMQAANDVGDLDDLRQFTTPEVFAELRLQLQERGAAAQHTDVVEVHAEVIEVAEEDGRQIVSVRYHGRAIEQADAAAQPFDEVWHLVRPVDGSRPWAIAGVQQRAEA
jgi:predicted lipid-binding transport protein (Tim44 family)